MLHIFFSVAYLRRYRDSGTKRLSSNPQNLRAICVGRSHVASSLLFYHPPTEKLLLLDDYRLDETLASSPAFGLKYKGGLYFNKYESANELLCPSTFAPQQRVFVPGHDRLIRREILTVLAYGESIYTVRYKTTGSIHQHKEMELTTCDP